MAMISRFQLQFKNNRKLPLRDELILDRIGNFVQLYDNSIQCKSFSQHIPVIFQDSFSVVVVLIFGSSSQTEGGKRQTDLDSVKAKIKTEGREEVGGSEGEIRLMKDQGKDYPQGLYHGSVPPAWSPL